MEGSEEASEWSSKGHPTKGKNDTSFYAEDGREKRTKRFRREAGAPRVTPRVDKVAEVDLDLISPYSFLHPSGESLLLSLVLVVVLCTGVQQGTRTGRCTREGTLARKKGSDLEALRQRTTSRCQTAPYTDLPVLLPVAGKLAQRQDARSFLVV